MGLLKVKLKSVSYTGESRSAQLVLMLLVQDLWSLVVGRGKQRKVWAAGLKEVSCTFLSPATGHVLSPDRSRWQRRQGVRTQ